ncbi:4-hydroxybenzoate octaprenyltransferase [Frankia sp. AgB1.9]|uniref:menaquinone biosynthesis prenyltransferase MqnP n=1 Tax=unclassified Frankia TaxID=2632575 RepID=UPI001933C32E|nr:MULTISPECIES: menaquinone biosynthesis prenyltransferase MqnP [unclassified Frankia]MBL7488445.1 4-hydroxybenzoate octaprenyltransferase [Frankia sp. AgW1.1]MBL7550143.1 4-hydroxybenzoate octaprenyltransferase [Frankia sp. AgB1.9]MBL7625006.1 4-hydroxybenzoate octaprenyltransferase [Frankia sp. AgB1.8]
MTEAAVLPGAIEKPKAFLRLVKIEHSVFALPFAYVAALAAGFRASGSVHWADLFLVTVAMVAARTFAMAANRIIDRRIDAQNPRTATRELVTGVVAVRTAVIGSVVALVVFLAAAAALGWLCLALAPAAVVPLVVYPYAKRFTDFPQVILGIAQAVAPIGAWIAITGHWSWAAVVLGLAVGTWIGGFDLIYACQDVEVDRRIGVRSVPARFGVRAALVGSLVTHVVTFGLFVVFGLMEHFGALWWVGIGLTAVAFGYEHAIVRPTDLSKVNRAFFTANGFVGIALFVFALVDLVVRGLHG